MVMLLVFNAAGRAQTNNPPGTNGVTEFPDDSALLPGLMVYQKNCVMCHGRSGDGRGEMGLTVQPRPRDFRKGRTTSNQRQSWKSVCISLC